MRRAFASFLFFVTLVLFAASPRLGFAQVSAADKAKAEQLKVAADEAMDNLHYSDALKGYQDAYALNPDPKLLYNMGRAKAALGDYPGAVADLDKFKADAPADLKAKVPQLNDIIAEFKKHVTVLTVTCNIPGARLLVNAKAVGTTPFPGPMTVNAGPTDLEMSADAYNTEKRKVTLPEGGTLTVDFQMQKTDVAGILIVKATPNADSSKIDDKSLGGTPLEVNLAPGQHTVRLMKSGFRDIDVSTVLGRGERKVLDLAFETSPVTAKWWFWTIIVVGAVVVAGAVAGTVYALTTEKDPTPGTIPPGIIKGP